MGGMGDGLQDLPDVRRAADLLGVSSRERIALRQRIAAARKSVDG